MHACLAGQRSVNEARKRMVNFFTFHVRSMYSLPFSTQDVSLCLHAVEEDKGSVATQGPLGVRSKWELVDYGDDSDDEEPST